MMVREMIHSSKSLKWVAKIDWFDSERATESAWLLYLTPNGLLSFEPLGKPLNLKSIEDWFDLMVKSELLVEAEL